jgi:hypothetical protein
MRGDRQLIGSRRKRRNRFVTKPALAIRPCDRLLFAYKRG